MVAVGKAPTTIKNAITIISQVFELVRTEWGIEGITNPVRGVRMPKVRPGRDRRLEPDEEPRLLDACRAMAIDGAFVWAIETDMHQGEMLALRWSEVRGAVAYAATARRGELDRCHCPPKGEIRALRPAHAARPAGAHLSMDPSQSGLPLPHRVSGGGRCGPPVARPTTRGRLTPL